MSDIVVLELESITGKVIEGNLTPIVFDLLKDTSDRKGLLKYLGTELEKHIEDNIVKVKPAPKFNDWFKQFNEI